MAKHEGLVSWKELAPGMYIIEPGNSAKFKTGDWRAFKPVLDTFECMDIYF